MLDGWWKHLSSRLDAGPAALHRLPESVAHVAEALWMQALDEGRRRAEQETTRHTRTTAEIKSDLEVRSHVLTLREGELDTRLKDRERQQATLETQLQELTTLLRREQATRDAQARRISALEDELLARPKIPPRWARPKAPKRQGLKQRPKRAAKLRGPSAIPKRLKRKKAPIGKRRR